MPASTPQHAPALSTSRKLLLLTGLYFSQGLPYGFFTQALPAWLRQQGVSLEHIGLTSLLAVPWAAKVLWSPLVDRWSGSPLGPRRGWILPLQLAAVALMAALALVEARSHLGLLMAMVLMTNLFSATQDVATDALAVDLLHARERGLGNGVQVAGYRAGMIVGGGALLMAFGALGWAGTFAAMAALLVIATLPVLALREAPRRVQPLEKPGPSLAILMGDRRAWPWFGVLLLFKAGEGAETAMLRPLLVDRGLDLAAIGWLMGTLGFAAGLLGALLGGWLADRLTHRTALAGCGLAQSLGLASWVLAAQPQVPVASLGAFVALEHLTSGMATAALFTAMMDRTDRQSAASHYTLQASLVVVGSGLAAALSGWSARHLGYAGHFGLCALLGLAGVATALRVLGSGVAHRAGEAAAEGGGDKPAATAETDLGLGG